MTDRSIGSTSGAAKAGPSGRPAAQPVPANAATPAIAADGLALGQPPEIEADVRLAMRERAEVAAAGTVRVRHPFLVRFIKDVLSDPRTFRNLHVGYDPATKRYAGSGTVRWNGVPVPVAIAARPSIVGDRLAVTFDAPRLRLGKLELPAPFLTGMAVEAVLRELGATRIRAERGAQPGQLLIEPSSMLHELGVMPTYVKLDTRATKLAMTLGETGDVVVALDAAGVPDAAAATPRSDLALSIDEPGLNAVMRAALAPDYELGAVRLRRDGAAFTGQADLKPVSDVLTLAKGLLILAAYAGSHGRTPPGMDDAPVVVRGRVDIDARIEGRTLIIKPSLRDACPEIEKLLAATRIPSTRRDDTVLVDLDAAAGALGAQLAQLQVDERGVLLRAGVDIDRLVRDQGRGRGPRNG